MKHTSLAPPPPGAIIGEALLPFQITSLALAAPFLATAPKGNGETVIVLPGYGAGDASTAVLRRFLRLLGYNATGWGMGANDGDVLRLLARMEEMLANHHDNADTLHLVGWSLGGYLAREVARNLPERITSVVTLGSPVFGGPKYTAVAAMFSDTPEALDDIERLVAERYRVPLTVPTTAIYSKLDGVVAWQACIDHLSPNVEHVEITSSHSGFGFSPTAFRTIADRLARHAAPVQSAPA